MDKKSLWKAIWDGDIKGVDVGRACFCIGPQPGKTKCPCQIAADAQAIRNDLAMHLHKHPKTR